MRIFSLLLTTGILFFWTIEKSHGQAHFSADYYKMEKTGDRFYKEMAYKKAVRAYKKAIKEDPANADLQLKLAESYWHLNQPDQAVVWYEKIAGTEVFRFEHHIKLAECLMAVGRFEEAEKWFTLYDQIAESDLRVKNRIRGIDQMDLLKANLASVKLEEASFNSSEGDFSPLFYGNDIAFVSARRPALIVKSKFDWDNSYYLNLYVADSAGEVSKLNEVNTRYHEGPSVVFDKEKQMIFTRNNYDGKLGKDKEGTSKLKLYQSLMVAGKWSEPEELPFNSEEYSTGHPAITEDGQFLVFASDRPGGEGETDLYYSYWLDSTWSEPKNLGAKINTEGKEMFPFLHPDGTLIFASNGHEGLGGLDVYAVRLDKMDTLPRHLGVPVNSPYDDFGLIVADNGKTGYLSSNRDKRDKIYAFEAGRSILALNHLEGVAKNAENNELLPDTKVWMFDAQGALLDSTITDAKGQFEFDVNPETSYVLTARKEAFQESRKNYATPTVYEKWETEIYLSKELGFNFIGEIKEKQTNEALEKVVISFKDRANGETFEFETDKEGGFRFPLTDKKLMDTVAYHVKISKRGYLSHRFSFEKVLKTPGDIYLKDLLEKVEIKLVKLNLGDDLYKLLNLNPIYFDLNKSNIRKDAAVELDKVVEALKDNPSMKIELGSHTDSRGSDRYNLLLSDKRAKSSAEYIIQNGIDADRIQYKGYGETQLVNACDDGVECSEEDHQLNRRTEIIIKEL